MKSKIIGTVCLVLGIIIIVSSGTSFAYFSATATTDGDKITGETADFEVDLKISTIYEATQIIPLSDDYIDDAIKKDTNKCRDSKGYEVCSLYEVTLTNSGSAQILNGFISTTSTTYETDHLKAQLFNSNYTALSDAITLSRTANDKVYFKSGTNIVATEINNSEIKYYLAIWLHETNGNQNEDFSKTFDGKIAFESLSGSQISAKFSA